MKKEVDLKEIIKVLRGGRKAIQEARWSIKELYTLVPSLTYHEEKEMMLFHLSILRNCLSDIAWCLVLVQKMLKGELSEKDKLELFILSHR